MDPALIPAALTAPLLVGLLWAKKNERLRAEFALKPGCSLMFLAVAFLQPAQDPHYALWLRVGLVASLLGDVFLIGKSRRGLAVGLVAFLLAHVFYLVAIGPRLGGASPLPLLGAIVTLVVVGAVLLRRAWPKMGRFLVPAGLYLLALSTMTGGALTLWLARLRDPGGALLGVGMLLFYVSDLAVARYRFVEPDFSNKLWGLPAYYAGQLLLAFSIGRLGG